MWCSDPLVTFLKQYGYNVVRLPRADIKPLQMLSYQRMNLTWLGDLSSVLVAGENIPLPVVKENEKSAEFSGQQTSSLKFGIGLGILRILVSAMGGSTVGLDTNYKQARHIRFQFRNVLRDKVALNELDEYLGDADINPFSRNATELLVAEKVYVTNSTVKSTRFTVEATRSDGAALEVSADVIQDVVGANVNVSAETETKSRLTYEGKVPLVFGFEAVRLFYDGHGYRAFEPTSAGRIAAKALESTPEDGAERLMTESPWVQVDDL
jgi:hypothetical protein